MLIIATLLVCKMFVRSAVIAIVALAALLRRKITSVLSLFVIQVHLLELSRRLYVSRISCRVMDRRGGSVVQREIQQDWANREYIEVITTSIKKISDFLNGFDLSCRSRLATLNEKLTKLERRIEYIEARVTRSETLS